MRASNEMLLREVAGEAILVPVGEIAFKIHGMISLTESGALLWKTLSEKDCSEDDLVNTILSEYCIDEATARADVHSFITKMDTLGIVGE